MTVPNHLVSIIMGVYNCEKTVGSSIEAIINQTYQNWELIICDDGSKDDTLAVINSYRDKCPNKIVVLQNNVNKGLNFTLNKCLKFAKGQYIARMDGDDVCSPERFEKEVLVLQQEPKVAFVSTLMEHFDETGTWGVSIRKEYPVEKDLLYGPPFCHAPCMIRKSAMSAVDGYSESKWLLRVEDYHLWVKLYQAGFKGKNIQEILYSMRDDKDAYARRKFRYRINECYVKILVVKLLKLSKINYIYALKPILLGILPNKLYNYLHKKKLQQEGKI